MNDDFLVQERSELKHIIEFAALEDKDVIGVLAIGSTLRNEADVYSDLDYYFYTRSPNWSRKDMAEWLTKLNISPVFHYWTGIEKHHMQIKHTRVDISTKPRHHQRDISLWPRLFFDKKSIIKDADGALALAIECHQPVVSTDEDNDRSAYIFNVILITQQLLRGEVVNAFSRMTGVIESKARLLRRPRLEFGAARWREASRKIEQEAESDDLSDIMRIIQLQDRDTLQKWLKHELLEMSEVEKSSHIKETTEYLLRKLDNL